MIISNISTQKQSIYQKFDFLKNWLILKILIYSDKNLKIILFLNYNKKVCVMLVKNIFNITLHTQ